ncbi:MAG: DNA polymerase III subunit delta [Pseudomonadota bacterium]
MTDTTPERFARDFAREIPAIVLIACAEQLDREEVGDATLRLARDQGYTERSVYHVERKDFAWHEVGADADALCLFSERRVLDVRVDKKLIDRKASDFLRAYAERPAPDTLLLLRTEYLTKRDKSAKWYQAIAPIALAVHAYLVKDRDMPRWLQRRAQAQGLDIAPDALRFLAERLEGNLLAAAQELSRLKLAGGGRVELGDVEESVRSAGQYRVWDMLDAAFERDGRRVQRMCRTFAAEGESVIPMLAALTSRLRGAALGARSEALLSECTLVDLQAKGAMPGDAWRSFERLLLGLGGVRTTPSLSQNADILQD